MNILLYDMGSYTCHDIIYYMKQMGHTVKPIYYHFEDRYADDLFLERFDALLHADAYDCVFSVNFFPLVARLAYEHQIPYLSWCYDSPMDERLQDSFHYDTNRIFLFDGAEALEYQAKGYSHIYHLPLAVNTARLDALSYSQEQISVYSADISFVGRLYESPLPVLLQSASDYDRGYIEGILQAQLRIYGCNLIDELIPNELLNRLNAQYRALGQTSISLNRRGLSYAIATQMTHIERIILLEELGTRYDTHFYSTDSYTFTAPVQCHGAIANATDTPGVYRHSRLNLCPTLRSIASGIPLRALDIMGCGGALLANYQIELAEHFTDGEDCILYESMEDAILKADYYLQHDEERQRIAGNGYEKVCRDFSYPDRLQRIFEEM